MARISFEEAAIIKYPHLATADTITRKEINAIVEEHRCSYPIHISNPTNSVSRGVFKFSVDRAGFTAVPAEPVVVETDEEIEVRIAETYETLRMLIKAVSENRVNSLIVAGGAGLGKSFETQRMLTEINGGDELNYVFHRGYLKATHLFRMLYENRLPGQTIVLDDVDVWGDETAVKILKAALELKKTRRIGWGSEKVMEDSDGEAIPRYFDFEGNIIFLTNLNFTAMATGADKKAVHLSALDSRSLVLDLKINTKREYLIKIKQTIKDGLLADKGLTIEEEIDIMKFMEENVERLKDLSLRSAEKMAVLCKIDPVNWTKIAKTVMLK